MGRKFLSRALLGLTVLTVAPVGSAAQPSGAVPPVPGPYQAMPAQPAPAAPGLAQGQAAQANPFSNPTHRPAVPYWMQRPEGQSRQAAPSPGNQPQFIPGWVWSPTRQNRAPQGQAQPPAPAGNTGWPPPYYGPGYGYAGGPQTPQSGQQGARQPYGQSANTPWAAWPQPPAPPGFWNAPRPGQPYWNGYPAPPTARTAPTN